MNVAFEVKEWITPHTLKRRGAWHSADRPRGGNGFFQDYVETRASLLCSMCFLTLLDRARSASRNS